MKMKRILIMLLCAAMLLPILAGCQGENVPSTQGTSQESTAPSTGTTGENVTQPESTEQQATQPPENTEPDQPQGTVTEPADPEQPQEPTQGDSTNQDGNTQGGNANQGGGTTQGGNANQGGGTTQGGNANQSGGTTQGGNTNQGGNNTQSGTTQGGSSTQGGNNTQGGSTSQGGNTSGGSTGSSSQGSTTLKPDNGDGIYEVGTEKLPYTQEQIYQQLFDLNNKVEIHLDMSEKELRKLQEDYDHYRSFGSKSPIYRLTDMLITITTKSGAVTYRIPEVGLRMKGNTSRTDFYSDSDGIYKYIHFKLDFQETFDDSDYYGSDAKVWSSTEARKERKNRTFATLEKLEMRWNKCYDSTYLREAYAYELYRSEGVLAPKASICSVDWSDVHMGIYTINEPVDEIFLERNLAAADLGGDLYKCGWTHEGASFTKAESIGVEDEDRGKFYIYDLKTNKKTSTHQSLKNLISKLNSGKVTKASFASLVDTDYFVSYAAVSYFLGNPDDLRNNYNNFYLYFLKSSGKAIFIPYDYDRCLGITVEYNPSGHAMTRDDPFSSRRESVNASQDNPLFIYSVDRGGYYVEEFADALNRVAENSLLSPATFERWFNLAKGHYSGDVRPSRTLRNAEGRDFSFDLNRTSSASSGSNMSFKDYINAKMSSFRSYMNKVDDVPTDDPIQASTHYIRGDFNNWSNHEQYAMQVEGNVYVITMTFTHSIRFKVYDNIEPKWYGGEVLNKSASTPDCTVDNHSNMNLPAGTYKVTYNPKTKTIVVEKA